MKQHFAFLFFLLLLSSFLVSPRLLQPPKGEKEVQLNHRSFFHLNDNMEELMGSEECFVKDEGCNSRRMMVEAHLDYIYTQHHKP
ncbi:putative phytosulfokines 6 [Vigna radiata var. radiata]|uniref:Phytosulfokine n=1 Tax=Vigna radiata var. radiata TaxID=3916 RepID=A0A1S3V5L3_VIGRR|nr:putative phytosulfokines 6 [Vigna radiata var. radiata]